MADRIGYQLCNYRIMRHIAHCGYTFADLGEHSFLKKIHSALQLFQMKLAEKDMEGSLNEVSVISLLESICFFTSLPDWQLTEVAIHHWFRSKRRRTTKDQWESIAKLSFHDLLHDFAHRSRAAGLMLEKVANYLGNVNSEGMSAIKTSLD